MGPTTCLKTNILHERENCSSLRTTIFKPFLVRYCHQQQWWQQPQPAAPYRLTCHGADTCVQLVVCRLQLGTACIGALNPFKYTTVLINKGSDLETTVSLYLSLGGFIFSVFGFSSSSYQFNATCTIPQFFAETLLTWKARGISGSPHFMF